MIVSQWSCLYSAIPKLKRWSKPPAPWKWQRTPDPGEGWPDMWALLAKARVLSPRGHAFSRGSLMEPQAPHGSDLLPHISTPEMSWLPESWNDGTFQELEAVYDFSLSEYLDDYQTF